MGKILTIGILQWSRLNWLDACLKSIPVYDSIEIIVVDDGIRNIKPVGGNTEEETLNIIKNYPNVIYRRRLDTEHFGINEQIIRLSNIAQGKYLWIIGNDDCFIEDLSVVLDQLNSDVDYIYVNYKFWKSVNPTDKITVLGTGSSCNKILKGKLIDFAFLDKNYFTPTYCSIMKTCHWLNAYKEWKDSRNKWLDLRETIPYAIYIIDNLLNKEAVHIGLLVLLSSYSVTWDKEPNANNWSKLFSELCEYLNTRFIFL